MSDRKYDSLTSIRSLSGSDNAPGEKLLPGMMFGRYVIRRVLGEGGMGVVYAAFDPTLNRKIAIKVLKVAKTSSDIESARTRMLREAQAMAMVGHPNLVQVFDVGTFRGDVFIAMEFVEGVTLRDWVENHPRNDWKTILKKFLHAAYGLDAAHERQLIHRDFKPENVMIDKKGHVRVMDFGLARHTGPDGDVNTSGKTPVFTRPLTESGMIVGTPAYMAPEQFLADYTDHRTDQFAFCVALFEALYGYRPYDGNTMRQLARKVMRGEITLPPKSSPVPDHVLTALLKGLQTEPEDRHDNMGVLIDALTTEAVPPPYDTPWLLYLSALLVASMGLYLYVNTLDPSTPPEEPQELVEPRPPLPPPAEPQGVITNEQVEAVVKHHQSDVDDCVEQGRKRDPDLEGAVDLRFSVVTSPSDPMRGEVERVWMERTNLYDTRTARCIMGLSMSWVFPSPACPGMLGCKTQVETSISIPAPKKKRRSTK